jgi:hypothetical protein
MAYLIYLLSVLLVAAGLRHFEPHNRSHGDTDNPLLSVLGPVAHVTGAVLIGWLAGPVAAALAFVAIPPAAHALHSMVFLPMTRSRRLRDVRRLQGQKRASSPQPAIDPGHLAET